MLLVYVGLIGADGPGVQGRCPKGFIPSRTRATSSSTPSSPTAPASARTDAVVARLSRDRPQDARASPTPSTCPGYSILLSTNISNVGGMFVILEPFEERKGHAGPRPPTRSPTSCASSSPRSSKARVARLRRAAGRRPGQHRRLQAAGAGPRAARAWQRCRAPCRTSPLQGNPGPAPDRPVQQLQRQPAAALRRRSTGRRPRARRSSLDDLNRHAPGVPRLVLRQRLPRSRTATGR